MVVENPCIGIIGAAKVIDDPVGAGGDPFGCTAADQLSIRQKPGQDHAGKELIGVKIAGMGDEIGGRNGKRSLMMMDRP